MSFQKGEFMNEVFINTEFHEQMVRGTKSMGITLSDHQLKQFFQYYVMMIETNKVMNLTAITELSDVVSKHFLDSLALMKVVKDLSQKEYSIIDVGTGAGFPGIPLKIAFPNLKMTLLDSLNKRVKFLQNVVNQLGLDNIEEIHGRAEDYGVNIKYREKYDFCVSRAVANLSTLSEYCLPFVKVGGMFISYKSGSIEEELNQAKGAIKLLGSKTQKVVKFSLEEAEAERAFVIIEKRERMSVRYPRKAGLPSKDPLK